MVSPDIQIDPTNIDSQLKRLKRNDVALPMPKEFKDLFAKKNRVGEVLKKVGYAAYSSAEYGSVVIAGIGLHHITGDQRMFWIGLAGFSLVGVGWLRVGRTYYSEMSESNKG